MRMTRAALRARAAEGDLQVSAEETSPGSQLSSPSRSPCRMKEATSPWKQADASLIVHEDESLGCKEELGEALHGRRESAEMAARALRDITIELNEKKFVEDEEKEAIGLEMAQDPFVEHVEQLGEHVAQEGEHVTLAEAEATIESTKPAFESFSNRLSDNLVEEQTSGMESARSKGCSATEGLVVSPSTEDEFIPRECPSPESEKLAASFDAMDKLEEEIEQVDAELKATSSRRVTIVSPAKVTITTPLTRKSVSAAISKRKSTPYRSHERLRVDITSPSARLTTPLFHPSQEVVTPRSVLRNRSLNDNITTSSHQKRATSTPLPAKLAAKSQTPPAGKTPAKAALPTHTRRATSTTGSFNQKPFIPTKSLKPPTSSTFQLPGEITAAKLKAAKEEREARRAAGQIVAARPTASATVKSTKPMTMPTFSLPGEETAARLKAQKEEREARRAAGVVEPETKPVEKPRKSSKPPTVCTFQLSSEATAAKLKIQKEERDARRAAGQTTSAPITKAPRLSLAIKSNKPLTTASFALSSDTTAAKLKAQKEERETRRAQQEEREKEEAEKERLRRLGKGHGRGLSTSVKPSIVPRENKASKIRIASGGQNSKGEDKENLAPLKH